ncbi:MAG: hypothetical protein EBT84_13040, partial [Sphingomonadaceae bacterium]|nr:hypothetical protein [Sphingomonadaceae bacterium]
LGQTPPLPDITERAGDDTAWLFYTSGTTGRPKGVMITHRNLMTMGLGYFGDVDPVAPDDAIVYAAPMSHGAGIYAIPHLMAGARHVVPASGGFDAIELFALGLQTGPLSLFAAPTIVKRLVDEAEARGHSPERCAQSFKTIVYGGAPMYAVMIFQTILIVATAFTHANIRLPKQLDAALSWVLVSPNMHKVHHHWKQPYTDSNYGAVLSIWDRLLGTFMKLDAAQIRYGLDRYYPNEKDEQFGELLTKPFGHMDKTPVA